MKWFGRSTKSDKKAEPLIHEVHALSNDEEGDIGVNMNQNVSEPGSVDRVPSEQPSEGIDTNIPVARMTSGERQMVMPKHLEKYNEEVSIEINHQETEQSYVPIMEVNTQSRDHGSHHDPTVVSAISLSTIGASVEREVERVRNMKEEHPPLEIKATKQVAKRKEKVSYFQVIHDKVNAVPAAIIDGLAGAYDALHGINRPKKPAKTLDDVPITARRFRRDHPDLLLPGNTPRVGFTACFAAIPLWVKYTMIGAVAAGTIATVAVQLEDTMLGEEYFDWKDEQFVDWKEEKSLAFIGNSYLYVNDIPRLMERISHGRIKQDSVINPSASLGKMLRAGNGMYELWQNEEALTYKYNTQWRQQAREDEREQAQQQAEKYGYEYVEEDQGEEEEQDLVYDFGSCTVFQLLEGYDNDITYMNYNGAYYYEEGANPCFEDQYYMWYLQDRNLKNPEIFDYVVLNDLTARMTDPEAREDSVEALKYAYAPMIKDSRATPLIVDTHAYLLEEEGTNSTGYGYEENEGIPYMQALIYNGVEEYLTALKANLPSYQEPRVVPIGLAFLVVWEEDYDMWQGLFLNATEMPYSSPHGSYLFANVLYATVYGHLPRRPTSNEQIKNFFRSARYLPELPEDWEDSGIFPTVQESDYYRLVARRVVLKGYIPETFQDARKRVEEDRIYGYQQEVCQRICENYEKDRNEGGGEGQQDGNHYNYEGNYNEEWDCGCEEEEEAAGEENMDEQQNRL